ncbi:MAG: AEC family transporter [Clostridia bacterium]|nr:AEC family transporter [Clostridia bacterium]
MSAFQSMLTLQMQLFVFVAAGFILTRTGTITKQGKKSLSDLLINFILPCNIICSFQMDMSTQLLASCGLMLVVASAGQLLFLLLSRVLFRRGSAGQLACLRYATVCSNAGFLGLPIIGGVFDAMGTLLTSVALIPQRVVMWSAGLSQFTKTDGRSVARKLITHPCIIAVFIGFVLLLCGNPVLPAFLQKALSSASGTTTCLSMMVIGSILAGAEHINWRDRTLWWFTLCRLVLIPLLVYAIMLPFPFDRTLRGVMVLIAGMPAGSTTAILAARYDGDAPFASCIVFITTLLSLITLPLLCLIL